MGGAPSRTRLSAKRGAQQMQPAGGQQMQPAGRQHQPRQCAAYCGDQLGEHPSTQLSCGRHSMHVACLQAWQRSRNAIFMPATCPLCRVAVGPQPPAQGRRAGRQRWAEQNTEAMRAGPAEAAMMLLTARVGEASGVSPTEQAGMVRILRALPTVLIMDLAHDRGPEDIGGAVVDALERLVSEPDRPNGPNGPYGPLDPRRQIAAATLADERIIDFAVYVSDTDAVTVDATRWAERARARYIHDGYLSRSTIEAALTRTPLVVALVSIPVDAAWLWPMVDAAIDAGNRDAVEVMISDRWRPPHSLSYAASAARSGHLDIAMTLLDYGYDFATSTDTTRTTMIRHVLRGIRRLTSEPVDRINWILLAPLVVRIINAYPLPPGRDDDLAEIGFRVAQRINPAAFTLGHNDLASLAFGAVDRLLQAVSVDEPGSLDLLRSWSEVDVQTTVQATIRSMRMMPQMISVVLVTGLADLMFDNGRVMITHNSVTFTDYDGHSARFERADLPALDSWIERGLDEQSGVG